MALAMIKKQNKCTVWYYGEYFIAIMIHCYPPLVMHHQYLKSIPLKITLSLA